MVQEVENGRISMQEVVDGYNIKMLYSPRFRMSSSTLSVVVSSAISGVLLLRSTR
jgi:hypothetical protein